MAEGRMLKKRIANSEKLGRLQSDKARVLYFMMLPHLDVEGRLEANPRVIKGQVTTMLSYSAQTIQKALEALAGVGLVTLYNKNGNQYVQYTRFEDFQTLNPKKEAKSAIPAPTQDNSGVLQRTPYKDKISKVKLSKDKYGEFVLLTKDQYQELIKKLTKPVVDQLIVDLNLGIGTHGYKYKSHYHVIQTWHRKNLKTKGGSAITQEKATTPVCIVCKGDSRRYQYDRNRKPVWLCIKCVAALIEEGVTKWGYLTKSAIEKIVEKGKASLAKRYTPKEPTHEASVNDKRNAAAKLIAETTKNFGKV